MKNVMKNMLLILGLIVITAQLNAMDDAGDQKVVKGYPAQKLKPVFQALALEEDDEALTDLGPASNERSKSSPTRQTPRMKWPSTPAHSGWVTQTDREKSRRQSIKAEYGLPSPASSIGSNLASPTSMNSNLASPTSVNGNAADTKLYASASETKYPENTEEKEYAFDLHNRKTAGEDLCREEEEDLSEAKDLISEAEEACNKVDVTTIIAMAILGHDRSKETLQSLYFYYETCVTSDIEPTNPELFYPMYDFIHNTNTIDDLNEKIAQNPILKQFIPQLLKAVSYKGSCEMIVELCARYKKTLPESLIKEICTEIENRLAAGNLDEDLSGGLGAVQAVFSCNYNLEETQHVVIIGNDNSDDEAAEEPEVSNEND